MPRWLALALALALGWLALPALAGVAADITRQTLESGHLQSGEVADSDGSHRRRPEGQ